MDANETFNAAPLCSVCAERPASLQAIVATEQGRRLAVMCASCAEEIAHNLAAAERAAEQRVPNGSPSTDESKTPALDEFGQDLTAEARNGEIDPVIGRQLEIEQTAEILARRRKNNVVLIGEAGVGKTASAEGLAKRIADGDVPEALLRTRVIALDLAGMVAGSQYRGQFEQRLKTVMEEVQGADGQIILFLDELHTVLGAGGAEGAMDAANILKPMLARGTLRMIGATTLAEFRKIEKDAALARRFSTVMVDEPTPEQTIEILQGVKAGYEDHHGCIFTDDALEAAVKLSARYMTDLQLPDKAIDLIDQAGAKLRLAQPVSTSEKAAELQTELEQAVSAEDYERAAWCKQQLAILAEQEPSSEEPLVIDTAEITSIVALRTGIPVGELQTDELARLAALEADLHERVVGQDAAVEKVADAVRRSRVGLSERDRPVGSFLFLGPTGVGKTELVKTLAERLFGSEDALVRIDMSEFRAPHTVARMIGSPPGYVGYGEGGQLTEAVRRRPYSVVLLDEVEKAHPEVWNVLLQLLDDGRLTDGEGRTVDFTNTVIVMTSNLGAGTAKRRGLGFTAEEAPDAGESMLAAVKDAFLPEFLGRIDEVITFHSLEADHVKEIAGLIVDKTTQRLAAEREIELTVSNELIDRLAADGFDDTFGARPLQRHIRRTLERALTDGIVDGRLKAGAKVLADVADDGSVNLEVLDQEEIKIAA